MINKQILDNALDIQHAFQTSLPFRHVEIPHFLEEQAAEFLLTEFPAFDTKRAINEFGEVGRKAQIDDVASVSTNYAKFYNYINSSEFLDAMSELTGIPDLLADATLFGGGTHENLDGQSLDVHIDFNIDERRMLHRRVNLLIYLNKEWDASWGGSIELHSDPRNPAVDEVKSFLPLFNRAVIFETNEYSWHGFETVCLPEGKKHLSRKSFSIYLYTRDRPAEESVAPHTTFYVSRPLPPHIRPGYTLNDEDMRRINVLLGGRDGLLAMYQKLLIEKEQRLRDFMGLLQDGGDGLSVLDHRLMFSSRPWQLIMKYHRFRHWLASSVRKLKSRMNT